MSDLRPKTYSLFKPSNMASYGGARSKNAAEVRLGEKKAAERSDLLQEKKKEIIAECNSGESLEH